MTVAGGTAPFTYNWSSGAQSEDLSNITAGIYTVNIIDANGCTGSAIITIGSTDMTLTASSSNTFCTTASGTATVIASGGTLPYTYSWNTSPAQTSSSITDLAQGNYIATVTDATGCTKTIPVCVGSSQSDFSLSPSSINDYCGKGKGSATVLVVGNSGPYTYVWNTTPVKTTPTITGLLSGNYTVTVTDAFGCSRIAAISVGNSQSNIILNTSYTSENCNHHNGTASVAASGGTAPYTYSWNTIPVKTTATVNGLSQGVYTVTVTDANGCSATKNIPIKNSPAPILTETHVNANCGKANGSIDLTVNRWHCPLYIYLEYGSGSRI